MANPLTANGWKKQMMGVEKWQDYLRNGMMTNWWVVTISKWQQ
jgi:hypothetical protein